MTCNFVVCPERKHQEDRTTSELSSALSNDETTPSIQQHSKTFQVSLGTNVATSTRRGGTQVKQQVTSSDLTLSETVSVGCCGDLVQQSIGQLWLLDVCIFMCNFCGGQTVERQERDKFCPFGIGSRERTLAMQTLREPTCSQFCVE